jgi:hypothetical protein
MELHRKTSNIEHLTLKSNKKRISGTKHLQLVIKVIKVFYDQNGY